MSLFIGNLSQEAEPKDLETAFSVYGKCKFNPKGKYGFMEFEKADDAEEAMNALQGTKFDGRAINISWSKKSEKYDPKKDGRPPRRDDDRGDRDRRTFDRRRRSDSQEDDHRKKRRERSRSRSHEKSKKFSKSRRSRS